MEKTSMDARTQEWMRQFSKDMSAAESESPTDTASSISTPAFSPHSHSSSSQPPLSPTPSISSAQQLEIPESKLPQPQSSPKPHKQQSKTSSTKQHKTYTTKTSKTSKPDKKKTTTQNFTQQQPQQEPKQEPSPDSWSLDVWNMEEKDMFTTMTTMFSNLRLTDTFRISHSSLGSFFRVVAAHYFNHPYHNFKHAFDVTQTLYVICRKCNVFQYLRSLDVLVLMVGGLVHDLEHPGVNNNFHVCECTIIYLITVTHHDHNHHHGITSTITMRPQLWP